MGGAEGGSGGLSPSSRIWLTSGVTSLTPKDEFAWCKTIFISLISSQYFLVINTFYLTWLAMRETGFL